MFLCVTPYGLVCRFQLFYQKRHLLRHGSEDFIFLQDQDRCLQGCTVSHHIPQQGTEPHVVTALPVWAGWTARGCYGSDCLPWTVQTLYQPACHLHWANTLPTLQHNTYTQPGRDLHCSISPTLSQNVTYTVAYHLHSVSMSTTL